MINFSHLIINGCSYAYSQNIPREQSWSYLVAEEFNLNLVMLAMPGASNARILRTTTDFVLNVPKTKNFKPLFLLSWTQQERREEYYPTPGLETYKIFKGYVHPNPVFMPITEEELKNASVMELAHFQTASTREGQMFAYHRKYMCWYHAMCMLDSFNYEYLMTDYFPECDENNNEYFETHYKYIFNAVDNHISRLDNFTNVGLGHPSLPCGHDGIVRQHIIADYVIDEIKKRYVDKITD